MKTMRKIASLLLALVMIFGLATTAFADDEPTKNDSITINNAKVGETYKLYKLFDLAVNDEYEPTAYSYTVNSNWSEFFAEGGDGDEYVTIDDNVYVTAISDPEALAKAAANWAGKPDATDEEEAESTTVIFSNLPDGYWLITSTLGTKAMAYTTPKNEAVIINDKNPEDTITKKVMEDRTGDYGDTNDAQIGDTVNFKSTATIVPGTRNVKIHDTMEDGLTFNEDSVVVGELEEGDDKDYILVVSPEDGHTFDIIFTDTYLNTLTAPTELTINYSAVLNENAVVKGTDNAIAIPGEKNQTQITYGDKQSVGSETTTTTHKFSVFKHAAGSTENLAGATFKLKKNGTVVKLAKLDDNNYCVDANGAETFTTVENGDIIIWGVDADSDYALEETVAPEGYNKLTEDVPVTVDAGNATQIDVKNNAGTVLPSTGGMGTTLFYVFGGILVVGAIVLLVTKKRMSAE